MWKLIDSLNKENEEKWVLASCVQNDLPLSEMK